MSREEELERENTKLKAELNHALPELKKNMVKIMELLSEVNEYTKKGAWFQSPSDKMQEAMDNLNENLKGLRSDDFNETVGNIQQSVKAIENLLKDN